jgi:hypothetical protein
VGGIDGLALQVTATGARPWVLRLTVADRQRKMGPGSFPSVTLAVARKKGARSHRAVVEQASEQCSIGNEAYPILWLARGNLKAFQQMVNLRRRGRGEGRRCLPTSRVQVPRASDDLASAAYAQLYGVWRGAIAYMTPAFAALWAQPAN